MILLREVSGKLDGRTQNLNESNTDKSFGIQEGRSLCRKITDRAVKGGWGIEGIRDSLAGVVDGLNIHILQFSEKANSPALSKISVILDDAFTEISKVR